MSNVQSIPFPSGTPNATWLGGGAAPGGNSNAAIGQYAGAAPTNSEYWLPIWSGEILNAYDQYNVFEPLVSTKAITSGTTMRFPITGTVGMKAQWKAGEELVGSNGAVEPSFFDISLDSRPMASHFELDDISLMLTQWEYRSEMARQTGLALANARDKQIACLIAQAAFMPSRSPAVTKGGNFAGSGLGSGSTPNLIGAGADANLTASTFDLPASDVFNFLGEAVGSPQQRANAALKLLQYIEDYMVRLQEMDGPTNDVYVAVTPQAFQDIRALGIARSTDANAITGINNMQPMFGGVAEAGGLGAGYRTGMNALTDTLEYMGATIIKTNHMLKQTVELDGSDYTVAADATAGQIDTSLDNIILDPTAATPFAQGHVEADKITDLGDAKYNFDWLQFRDIGAGDNTDGAFDAMFPVKALIWQKEAVASLNFQGLKVDTVQDVRRNTTFTVASKMSGGGVLRPELCAAICGSNVS